MKVVKTGLREMTLTQPAKPRITEQQLRTLSRKHLLLMILDLETELAQEKEKNENMLRAFRAGLTQQTK